MRALMVPVALLVVLVGWPVAPATAAEAIAVPSSGELKVTKYEAPGAVLQMIVGVLSPVPLPQQYTVHVDGEVAIQIAGLPATWHLSATISSTTLVIGTHTEVKADPSVLRTPAGEIPVDVDFEEQVPMMGSPHLIFRLRGANGSGLFESVRLAGALRGDVGTPSYTVISVNGTFFLGFRSVDEARAAAERGLAANSTLTEEQRAQFLERVTAALGHAQARDFPTDVAAADVAAVPGTPPDRAVVEHTVRREGERFLVSLRIVVPAGDAKQPIRVVAVGPEGARTVYEGTHAPGEVLQLEVEGTDPLIIQVYVAGKAVAQIRPEKP